MSENSELYPRLCSETWYKDDERSVALVTLCGLNDRIVNHRSDMRYEVMAGCGVFNIGDSCVVYVEEGATIYIPAGTQYHDEGKLMMLATATPPFNPTDVDTLS